MSLAPSTAKPGQGSAGGPGEPVLQEKMKMTARPLRGVEDTQPTAELCLSQPGRNLKIAPGGQTQGQRG